MSPPPPGDPWDAVQVMLRSITIGALLFSPTMLGESLAKPAKVAEEDEEGDDAALLAPAAKVPGRDRDRSRSTHSRTSVASSTKLAMVATGADAPGNSHSVDVDVGEGEDQRQPKSYLAAVWPLLVGIFVINALQTGGSALAGAMPSQNNNKVCMGRCAYAWEEGDRLPGGTG
jgi:hypothetical protein